MADPRQSRQWQLTRQKAKKVLPTVCYRCGGEVDLDLPSSNRMHANLDHKIPVSRLEGTGISPYDLENLAWAHAECNKRAGSKLAQQGPPPARPVEPKTYAPVPVVEDGAAAPPRIESDPHPDAVGSYGLDAIDWIENSGLSAYGDPIRLRPWQQRVLLRALEHDEDGTLVWPTVVLTVPRQQGKSIILAALATWRMAQPELLGQSQAQILFTSNKRETASLILNHAQQWASEKAEWKPKYGAGRESLQHANGSTWRLAAATTGAGTGTSNHMVLVDEAWQIKRHVYDDYLSPTMYARQQKQAWLVSTAGESESDLLIHYRDQALAGGNILILEWSAHPDHNPHDEATWRACTPHWEPHTLKYLTDQHNNLDIEAFQRQLLNQWVERAEHWIRPFSQWHDLPVTPDPIPAGLPSFIALEADFDGLHHALIHIHKTPDGQLLTTYTEHTRLEDALADAEQRRQQPNTHLTITPTYGNRTSSPAERMVGAREMNTAQQHLQAAIRAGTLHHEHHPTLTTAIKRSRLSKTQRGWSLSAPPGEGGVQLARALAFAVDSATLATKPAAVVITRNQAS